MKHIEITQVEVKRDEVRRNKTRARQFWQDEKLKEVMVR